MQHLVVSFSECPRQPVDAIAMTNQETGSCRIITCPPSYRLHTPAPHTDVPCSYQPSYFCRDCDKLTSSTPQQPSSQSLSPNRLPQPYTHPLPPVLRVCQSPSSISIALDVFVREHRTCGLAASPGLNWPVPLLVKQHSVYPAGPGKRPAPAAKMADLQVVRAGGGTKKTSLNL